MGAPARRVVASAAMARPKPVRRAGRVRHTDLVDFTPCAVGLAEHVDDAGQGLVAGLADQDELPANGQRSTELLCGDRGGKQGGEREAAA